MGSTSVAIIGAGLTGLAAAYHLRRLGLPCRLFEAGSRPGGLAVTSEEQGYRFDRTGHVLHMTDQTDRALALACIGPGHREVTRRSAIWSHGVYTPYPFQANLHGLPPAVAYECLLGFVEAEVERRQAGPPRPSLPSFEQYSLSTFGRGISEHFMLPYNSRMWGVPPAEITADWCSRFVPVPSLAEVVAGAVGLTNRQLGYNATFLYPDEGIGALADGLAQQVGEIEYGSRACHIHTARRELQLAREVVHYEVLINTAPLPELVASCEDAPPAIREAAAKLRCTHLYYLDLGLREPPGVPYHWVYVPESRYPFYRVGSYSNIAATLAPAGRGSLYVELCERRQPDLATILPQVIAALVEMGWLASPAALDFARVRRIDHAYVIFDHAYVPTLEVLEAYLTERRILSRGRYGGWNYSSMSDALRFGREAAVQAAPWLGGGEGEPR